MGLLRHVQSDVEIGKSDRFDLHVALDMPKKSHVATLSDAVEIVNVVRLGNVTEDA